MTYHIFSGFNSTLRQGNITHHEYFQVSYGLNFVALDFTHSFPKALIVFFLVQVGKGRDVGLNQIALFEGKVAGGNGEQVLSRDVYRIGQLFDFFRMLSFYYTTVGFYVCTMVCYPYNSSFYLSIEKFITSLFKVFMHSYF